MSSQFLDAALTYAEYGIPVFPLKTRGKEPFQGTHGAKDATTDTEQIRRWWTEHPDANIGGCAGNGLIVIDIDVDDATGKDGYETLREWEREHGELPDTVTAITGRGGMHAWYRTDMHVSNSVNGDKGIDVRGDGGYVVMPPSVHSNGNTYEWEWGLDDRDITTADSNVLEFIDAMRPKKRGRPRKNVDAVAQGGRNDYLYRYGCSLRADVKMSDEDITTALIVRNNSVCKPPLPSAEIERLIDSVLNLEPGHSDEVKEQAKSSRKFDHAKIAQQLIADQGACFIDGMPAIIHNGRYAIGWNAISREVIGLSRNSTKHQQKEVHHYISIMGEQKQQSRPELIAFKNGILDVETMELREWSEDDTIPNIIPHEWHADAECPAVDVVLKKIACNDADTYGSLIETMGMCMYRSAEFTQSAILLGGGSNGKSTYIRMLQALLGRENISALDMSMLGKQFHTGLLAGKLANLGDDISNEFQNGALLATFKKVVDGNRLHADVKGTDGFDFEPYAMLVFSANEFPRLADYTDGMMRRIFPIEFNAKFSKTDSDFDPHIARKITSEEACERMCVLGVLGLERLRSNNGFTPTSASDRRIDEIRTDNDTILAWIADVGWSASSIDGKPIAQMYEAYKGWCGDCGLQAVGRPKFTRSANGHLGTTPDVARVNGNCVRVFRKSVTKA